MAESVGFELPQRYISCGVFNTNPVFTSDEKYYAIGLSRKIKIYATDTGKTVATLVQPHVISSLAVIKQRNFLVSGDSTGILRVWDIEQQRILASFKVSTSEAIANISIPTSYNDKLAAKDTFFAFVTQGKNLYEVRIDLSEETNTLQNIKHELLMKAPKSGPTINLLCAADDRSVVAIAYGTTFAIFNLASERDVKSRITRMQHTRQMNYTSIAYCEESQAFALGDEDGTITLQYSSGTTQFLTWHPTEVSFVQFSADGNYLYSGGKEGMLVLWQLESNTKQFFFCASPVKFAAINNLQNRYICVTAANEIIVTDPTMFRESFKVARHLYKVTGLIRPIEIQAERAERKITLEPKSGNILVTGTSVLQWYDFRSEAQVNEEYVHFKALAFNPSRFKDTKPLVYSITNIAFSPSATYLAHSEVYGENLYNLKIWKRNGTFSTLHTVVDQPHNQRITNVAMASTERHVVTSSLDGTVKVWERIAENPFFCSAVLEFKGLPANDVAFSTDGSVIFAAFGQYITAWDRDTATLLFSSYVSPLHQIEKIHNLNDSFIAAITRTSVVFFSMESMKIVAEFSNLSHNVSHICKHPSLPEVTVVASSASGSVLMTFVVGNQVVLKGYGTTNNNIVAIQYVNDDSAIYLTAEDEIYEVGLTPSDKYIADEPQEEPTSETREKWLKNVVGSLQTKRKTQPQEQITYVGFDPQKGIGAWKPLFNTPSHALVSTTAYFRPFMDNFLLKPGKAKAQTTQQEKTANSEGWRRPEGQSEKKKQLEAEAKVKEEMQAISSSLASLTF